ncbi:glycerate kinase [Candidatus Bipolaricaulota bacterium]|nr:glycerate kinase [Candidatus Bipolaricaulota bacterium]
MEKLKEDARRIIQAALSAVDPQACVLRFLRREKYILWIREKPLDLRRIKRVFVVGFGKASAAMAQAVEEVLGERIEAGIVVTAEGNALPAKATEVREASHPIPDERGVLAAKAIRDLATKAEEDDLVLVLISGGGSALLPLPREEITLGDLQKVNDLLLRSGATIQEMNAVRKHLEVLKGGGLAKVAFPAQVISLILSDVPGDPLDVVASGPTVPDPSTYSQAIGILKAREIWEKVPDRVQKLLLRGEKGEIPETPKPGDPCFSRVENVLVGNGAMAAEAALEEGKKLGYPGLILTTSLQGEAREVGKVFASIAREMVKYGRPVGRPGMVVAAGETTVVVKGKGKGGRNQELALSAALEIEGLPLVLCAFSTDGKDGSTEAAGALLDGETALRIRAKGVDPEKALLENDSYHALEAAGDLIITGPTGTNVADLVFILSGKEG